MPTIQTINPATEEICATYPLMTEHEVEKIIQKMHLTQKSWKQSAHSLRQKCLRRLAELLLEKQESAAKLITTEMGKPITDAKKEVEKCASLCSYYAENGPNFLQNEMVATEHYKSYRAFEPLGIIFAIMPWNFPFWQVMRFALPNLMAGNGGLLKHAPNTTGTALFIENLMREAGFPEDLFRAIVIEVELVPFIIHHPKIAGVTLTGSQRAGKSVAKEAGEALKKVVLELGGNDPFIILEDADLELAALNSVTSRLNNAGQVCIAAKRIIVVDKIRAEFEALMLKKAKEYQMADPLDPKTKLGPMARSDLRKNIDEQVQRAIASGARCISGGKIPEGKGYYYPMTILVDVNKHSPVFQEEFFGPVICLVNAKDEEEALELANMTEFGLAGAIFTKNLEKGEQLARANLEAGTVAVNKLVSSDPRLPFGGIKQSGYGRELSLEGMREFVNVKTIIVA